MLVDVRHLRITAEMYALDCYWASFIWLEADADFVREGLTPAE